jgi:hypothetical protein
LVPSLLEGRAQVVNYPSSATAQISPFFLSRRANVLKEAALTSSELSKVATRLRKTEVAIRAAADLISVLIILSIVFPKADFANLESSAANQRAIPAARATI